MELKVGSLLYLFVFYHKPNFGTLGDELKYPLPTTTDILWILLLFFKIQIIYLSGKCEFYKR